MGLGGPHRAEGSRLSDGLAWTKAEKFRLRGGAWMFSQAVVAVGL